MPEQDAPYDPYIPSGQAGAQDNAGGNARTQALQAVSCKVPLPTAQGAAQHDARVVAGSSSTNGPE